MKLIQLSIVFGWMLFSGCSPTAKDYFVKGNEAMQEYNCSEATKNLKIASEMEIEEEGELYPIYMLGLGLTRYYCNDLKEALNTFTAIDKYTVLRSNRSVVEKGVEFLKTKNDRTYELSEREETLLHYYMGVINFKLENYEDALIEFKKVDYIADGNFSKLPLIALMRGMTYEKLNDLSNALVAYKKIIEKNPLSPVGYIMGLRLEIDEEKKIGWQNKLLTDFNIDVKNLTANGKEIITIIECNEELSSDYKFQINYNDFKTQAYFFDAVDPEFKFDDFANGVIKEIASSYARNTIRNIAESLIPGGGLLTGLILGGSSAERRYWYNLPNSFVVDVCYLPDDIYDVKIKYFEDEELKKSKELCISNDVLIFVTNF